MQIKAERNEDTGDVRLIQTILNSSTALDIDDAHTLGEDLAQCLMHDQVEDIHRDAYSLVFTAQGVSVRGARGAFEIHWRHLMHVADQLSPVT